MWANFSWRTELGGSLLPCPRTGRSQEGLVPKAAHHSSSKGPMSSTRDVGRLGSRELRNGRGAHEVSRPCWRSGPSIRGRRRGRLGHRREVTGRREDGKIFGGCSGHRRRLKCSEPSRLPAFLWILNLVGLRLGFRRGSINRLAASSYRTNVHCASQRLALNVRVTGRRAPPP
jgi:hypothetical protein